MEKNGSPPPLFETDENHSYFLVTLPIHPEATYNRSGEKIGRQIPHNSNAGLPKPGGRNLKTHRLDPETRRPEKKLPAELQSKMGKLHKRSKNEEVKLVICALCSWKDLTAQEIAGFLKRRDKKHLVTHYLTPLVKEGKLKYVYPERGNSPKQAYTV